MILICKLESSFKIFSRSVTRRPLAITALRMALPQWVKSFWNSLALERFLFEQERHDLFIARCEVDG